MFRRKRALWSTLYSARENSIGVITDIRHMNNCRINDISIIEIISDYIGLSIIENQIIISIVRVSEHFSKMLVLSGVLNTRILDATNYANQDYMHVKYTLIVVYTMLLVTGSQSKNVSVFAWIWPNSDRWLVNHCALPSIGQTWVFASNDAVFEMGDLIRTLKKLLLWSLGWLKGDWGIQCTGYLLCLFHRQSAIWT
jgi:hypothetical protein